MAQDTLLSRFLGRSKPAPSAPPPGAGKAPAVPAETATISRPAGHTTTPEERLRLLYQNFEPDFSLRQTILDIRQMDKADGRVKKIHGRTARAACKGGLKLVADPNSRLHKRWDDFVRRLGLDRPAKLESDMRGLMMEGNIPMEWVMDADQRHIIACQRLPTDTLKALVDANGRFKSPLQAYEQWDWTAYKKLTSFSLLQLTVGRLQPDNYDNWGCFGRPYLDASRSVWRKLCMTETDLVIRRHHRAPMQRYHYLEGAKDADIEAYEGKLYNQSGDQMSDVVSNKKGSVQTLQGDANLDQIKDVAHLLDTFFAGAPAPKGLFGFAGDLSRDILEDLKRDFFDELDSLQDEAAFVYQVGFIIDLVLQGVNPSSEKWTIQFSERRTETANQRADLALKYIAAGASQITAWETAGIDPTREQARKEDEAKRGEPYGEPGDNDDIDGDDLPAKPRAQPNKVSVTPGNARKGESATDVSIRS